MTKLSEKFNKISDLVWHCLKEFPETRGDDKELMLRVWDMQGWRIPNKLRPFFIHKVASPESIRRCRQLIQAEGLYQPEPFKVAERSLFAMEYRNHFRKEKKND